MTFAVGVPKGTRFGVRGRHSASDLKKLPDGTWEGPALGARKDPHTHGSFEDLLFVDDTPRDKATQHKDWRHLTLWADPRREAAALVVETESADDGNAIYRVVGPAGEPLGRVTRRRGSVAGFRRTSWHVELPGGAPLHAVKGGAVGWFFWWLFSPLWAVMLAAILFGGEFPRMPLQAHWRRNGEDVFWFFDDDFENQYEVEIDWPDVRVLHGLAVLHHSHPTPLSKHNRA
ncbi:hypothetical protein [Embleya sp. NBC_00896]|uniref:hypothetical protein n=1 Tax=Embleya sp. NBC_00896 TaxID=2975961 RepID=UPI00386A0F9E|nr:hypothetical protein OG928_05220 [Embleya sp. NBC_00896]